MKIVRSTHSPSTFIAAVGGSDYDPESGEQLYLLGRAASLMAVLDNARVSGSLEIMDGARDSSVDVLVSPSSGVPNFTLSGICADDGATECVTVRVAGGAVVEMVRLDDPALYLPCAYAESYAWALWREQSPLPGCEMLSCSSGVDFSVFALTPGGHRIGFNFPLSPAMFTTLNGAVVLALEGPDGTGEFQENWPDSREAILRFMTAIAQAASRLV